MYRTHLQSRKWAQPSHTTECYRIRKHCRDLRLFTPTDCGPPEKAPNPMLGMWAGGFPLYIKNELSWFFFLDTFCMLTEMIPQEGHCLSGSSTVKASVSLLYSVGCTAMLLVILRAGAQSSKVSLPYTTYIHISNQRVNPTGWNTRYHEE